MTGQTTATLSAAIVNAVHRKIITDRGDDGLLYRNAISFTLSENGSLQIVKSPPPTRISGAGSGNTNGVVAEGSSGGAKTFVLGKEVHTPYKYCGYWQVTPEQMASSIKQVVTQYSDDIVRCALDSVEMDLHQKFTCNSFMIRADNNSTYQKVWTIDAAGSATTTWETDELAEADHFWVGAVAGFTSGKNWGQFRAVDAFLDSENEIGLDTANIIWGQSDACGETPADNDTGWICTTMGIDNSVVFSTTAIELAFYYLTKYRAKQYKGTPYQYKFGIQPQIGYDLGQDTSWKTSAMYNDSTKLERGFQKMWFNCLGYTMDEMYRTAAADGTTGHGEGVGVVQNATGAVFYTPFWGPENYGCLKLTRHSDQGTGIANIRIDTIDKPDSNNINLAYITYALKIRNAAAIKNGLGQLTVASGSSMP